MRIYTQVSFNLRTKQMLAVFEEYAGPVAYAFGGSDVTNETVPTGPWGPQIPYIQGLFAEAARLYNQGVPQAFPGVDGQLTPDINANLSSTQGVIGDLAGGNINQNQLIQGVLQAMAGQTGQGQAFGTSLTPAIQSGLTQQLTAGGNPLTGIGLGQYGNINEAYRQLYEQFPTEVGTPGTQGGQADASSALATLLAGGGGQNPYLEGLVQDALRTQSNQFLRNVLPGIRSEANLAGQPGGTRQGIAEGIAAGDFINSIQDTTANIYGNAFGQQLGAQGQALANVLQAQQGDQSAALQAAGLTNQNYQQYIQSLLQGNQQLLGGLGQGLGLGYDAIGRGTGQAGNLFGQGNQLQLQQVLGSLGLIPGFQAGSLAQMGAVNQLGLQQYGLDQATIDSLAEQYYFNQNAPFNLLSQYQQYVTGPYGSTVGNMGYWPSFLNPISPGGGGAGDPSQFPTYPWIAQPNGLTGPLGLPLATGPGGFNQLYIPGQTQYPYPPSAAYTGSGMYNPYTGWQYAPPQTQPQASGKPQPQQVQQQQEGTSGKFGQAQNVKPTPNFTDPRGGLSQINPIGGGEGSRPQYDPLNIPQTNSQTSPATAQFAPSGGPASAPLAANAQAGYISKPTQQTDTGFTAQQGRQFQYMTPEGVQRTLFEKLPYTPQEIDLWRAQDTTTGPNGITSTINRDYTQGRFNQNWVDQNFLNTVNQYRNVGSFI